MMENQWFSSHRGQTKGPFTSEELKDRMALGKIEEDDPLWVAGSDLKSAIPARAALDFTKVPSAPSAPPRPPAPTRREPAPAPVTPAPPAPSLAPPQTIPSPPAATGLPDWLQDVEAMEKAGPPPEPPPSTEVPDWLEDLRLWIGLDLYTPSPPPPIPEAAAEGSAELALPPSPEGLPEWLE